MRSLTVSESIRRVLAVIATVIGIVFACEALAGPCTSPDNLTRVTGGNECLVIHTFGAAVGNRTLVVFIHGDGSKGGPSDYLAKAAERVAGDGVTGVVLIRPGYYDSDGAKSTGTSYRRRGDGYRDNIIAAVAGAVAELKSHHSADRVVLVGHSGGAAISGVILGNFPGLANAAVLAACPCNVNKWRSMRGRGPWTRSRSPHRFLDAVPTDIEVVALTGRKDKNTKPVLAREYVAALKERAVTATFVVVANASHNRVARSKEFLDAVARLAGRR